MTRVTRSVLIAASGGVLVGIALTRAAGPFAGAKVQTLLRQELSKEFTLDREILIDLVEIPPHTTLDRHWHPGEEFHYYLEGEVEIAIDGAKPVAGKAGTTVHVPYQAMHTAITKEKGAKLIAFRVHRTGEPMRYLEADSTAKR